MLAVAVAPASAAAERPDPADSGTSRGVRSARRLPAAASRPSPERRKTTNSYYLGTRRRRRLEDRATAAQRGNRFSRSSAFPQSARSRSIRSDEKVVWAGTGESQSAQRRKLRRRHLQDDRRRQDAGRTSGLARHASHFAHRDRSQKSAARRRRRVRRSVSKIRPTAASTSRSTAGRRGRKHCTSARERRERPGDGLRTIRNVVYAGIWQFRRAAVDFHQRRADDGLYKSTDGGQDVEEAHRTTGCRRASPGASGWRSRRAIRNRVYALIEAKGGILWRSDDGGAIGR